MADTINAVPFEDDRSNNADLISATSDGVQNDRNTRKSCRDRSGSRDGHYSRTYNDKRRSDDRDRRRSRRSRSTEKERSESDRRRGERYHHSESFSHSRRDREKSDRDYPSRDRAEEDFDDYKERWSSSSNSCPWSTDDRRRDDGERNRDSVQDNNDGRRINGKDWKNKLTSIREAHFNRSKQLPVAAQNHFRNDGSFLEMFKQRMAQQSAHGDEQSLVTPNSLVLASSSIAFSPELSLPPLTASVEVQTRATKSSTSNYDDVDGSPMAEHKPIPMPVSVGKRRLTKPLKTGIVFKKPQKQEEAKGSQEQIDAWSSYLQEVQKYKKNMCIEEDVSRPLVK